MTASQNINCPSCQEENTRTHVGKTPSYCSFCRFPLSLLAGKYKIEKALSEGGFGIVYLAHHVLLDYDTERVVKVLKPEVFKQEEHMHRRFRREVQVTSALSQQNEHIVRIYDDFGEDPNLGHYYVMEFLKGQPLEDIMPTGKGLDDRITFKIFGEVCMAMAAAHHAGIIHRDLKPDNIFLEKRRTDPYFVKVLDFGIAKPMGGSGGAEAKMTQGAMGTPAYMSPEQCLNEEITPQADIYALGIILYELMTGRNPFNLDLGNITRAAIKLIQAHLVQHATPLSHWRSDVPQGVEDAVMKAMAKRPDERHESVEVFWNALRQHAPLGWGLAPLFEHYPSLPSLPSLDAGTTASVPEAAALEPGDEGLGLAATHVAGALDELAPPANEERPEMSTRQLSPRGPLPTSQPDIPEPMPTVDSSTTALPTPDEGPIPKAVTPHPDALTNGRSKAILGLSVVVVLLVIGLLALFFKKDDVPGQTPGRIAKTNTTKGLSQKAMAKVPGTTGQDTPGPRPRVVLGAPDAGARTKPPTRPHTRPARRRVVVRRQRRRAPPQRLRVGPCGAAPKGLRWIVSRLRKPAKGKPQIKFPGCRRCRLKRRGRYMCLGVPKGKGRVKVRIVMEGQASCARWLTTRDKRIEWYLKYEDLDSMSDESYSCVKSIR